MNQTIGIEFTATGQDRVVTAVKEIKESLSSLSTSAKQIGEALDFKNSFSDKIVAGMGKVAGHFEAMAKSSKGIQSLASAVTELAGATERLVAAQAGMTNYKNLGRPSAIAASGGNTSSGPPVATVVPGSSVGGKVPMPTNGYGESWREVFGGQAYLYPGGFNKSRINSPPGNTNNDLGQYGAYWAAGHTAQALNKNTQGVGTTTGSPSVFSGQNQKEQIQRGGTYAGLKRFMLYSGAYRGIGAAIAGTEYAGADIAMGRSRDDISLQNRKLVGIDMNQKERAVAEASAADFLKKHPYYTMADYLETRSEVGSGYSQSQIGSKTGEEITQAALKLGVLAQMKGPEAANLITDRMKAEELQMTPEERQKNIQPNSEYFQKRPGELVGLTNAAIREGKIWGKDIREYQKNAMALEKQMGISPERSMAYLTVLKGAGFRSSSIGMGSKTMSGEESEVIARLQMLNEKNADGSRKYDPLNLTSKKYKEDIHNRIEENARQQAINPYYNAEQLVMQTEIAKQSFSNPHQLVKANKHYRSQYSAKAEESFLAQVKEKEDIYIAERKAGSSKVDSLLKDNKHDMVSQWDELSKAAVRSTQSISKLVDGLWGMETVIKALNSITKNAQDASLVKSSIQDLEKKYPKGKPIQNRAEFAQDRAKMLKDAKVANMSKTELHRLMLNSSPEMFEHVPESSFPRIDGAISWFKNKGETPFSETHKITPFANSLYGSGPVIQKRDTPLQSWETRMDVELDAAMNPKVPDPSALNPESVDVGPLGDSAQGLKEAAQELKEAAQALNKTPVKESAPGGRKLDAGLASTQGFATE